MNSRRPILNLLVRATTAVVGLIGLAAPAAAQSAPLLQSGQAIFRSLPTGEVRYFRIEIPASDFDSIAGLNISLTGSSGDADVYARPWQLPQIGSTNPPGQYSSTGSTSNESLDIGGPAEATWYIAVFAYEGFQNVRLRATLRLRNNGVYVLQQAPTTNRYFQLWVPPSRPAAYFWLRDDGGSPIGDPDLYVRRGNYPTPSVYSWYSGVSPPGDDLIEVTNPASGMYYIRVYEYEKLLTGGTSDRFALQAGYD